MELKNRYRSWLDIYYDLFPEIHFIIISIVTGTLLYAIGLLLSLFGGFFHLYVTTSQTYYFILGIVWVSSWMRWGSINIFKMINKIQHQYNFSQENTSIENELRLIGNNRLFIFVSILLSFSYYIVIYIFWIKSYRPFGELFCFPKFLPQEWYEEPGITFKYIHICLVATEISFLAGTSGMQILIYSFRAIKVITETFVFKVPRIAAEALKPFGDFSLKTSFAWFVAVAITMVAGFRGFSSIVCVYLSLFTLIGISVFFLPQYFIHQSLKGSRDELSDNFGKKYEKFIKDASNKNYKDLSTFMYIFFFNSIYSNTITSKTWLFDYTTIIKLIAYALIPIASLIFEDWILTYWAL